MEDDKTPASPRKRAAKATPTDTSNPSATTDSAAADPGRATKPRRVPPATFVPPQPAQRAQPAQPTAPAQPHPPAPPAPPSRPIADEPPPSPTSATDRQPVKKAPAKKAPAKKAPAKKAPAKKAASEKVAEKPQPESATGAAPAPPTGPAPAMKAVKKAAPAAVSTPPVSTPPAPTQEFAERPTPAPAPPAPAPPAPAPPAVLWPTIKAHPGYATELLALAAVSRLGPQARTEMRWLRDTYPNATTHGLARMATSRSVRQARVQGAASGLLGPLALLAGAGALLWTQARLVLDIAAAYGRDPADPERAVELLALLRVHPDLTAAREAVTAARAAAADTSATPQVTLALVRVVGRALGRMTIARRVSRIAPGAGAALTAVLDGRATEQLAVRAAKFYRS